jgi:hypothetical protein
MPVRDQLIGELGGEDDLGVLLVAQMGGGPNEIQLIVETAQYEEAAGGLRQRGGYIIRAINTQEHRLSLGIFGSVFFTDVHPILLHHNEAKREIHFEGVAADVNELVLDIHQTYASTFGPWRELVRDIRRDQPLVNLLSGGGGVLGTMPQTAAERMVKTLEHHGLRAWLEGEDAKPSPQWKLLAIGDSYFVAIDFSVDTMARQ